MRRLFALCALVWLCPVLCQAAANYALTRYGTPKYPVNFTHVDYVNPDAPKGGTVKMYQIGAYDSLQPFLMKGVKAPDIGLLFESLMLQSLDEPETYYGLIAESVDVAEDFSKATFNLRSIARWHDGTPITPDDVVFSFTTLKEKGDPNYNILFTGIEKVEKTGERQVTFFFNKPARELPLIAASMPIVSKNYYATHDFEKTTLESPLGSGPYKVEAVDVGRSITYERVKDYWGKDLPIRRGSNNFDHFRYDMYRDEGVAQQAFMAGEYDFRREYIARIWATAYVGQAVESGKIVKTELPSKVAQGMQGFIYNLRRPYLSDRRVREAIAMTLDYEWINKTMFYNAYARNDSYFKATVFESKGLPSKEELALLEPFKDSLPPKLFTEAFTVPKTDGSGNNRPNLRKADALLVEAGWVIKDGVRVNEKTGEPLHIEFMLRQPTMERVILPMKRQLSRLGIEATILRVDDAQYQRRIDTSDFDIHSVWLNQGINFPGAEQSSIWHSSQADLKGSNNTAGLKSPAVDAMLAALTAAKTLDELSVAGRALDRILLFEHLLIPNWNSNTFRVAYWNKFEKPSQAPGYDMGLMTWWVVKKP